MELRLDRSQRKWQETHRKIRQAALDLLREKSFDSITVQNITDRADFARATFYLHYKDKTDLFVEVFEEFLKNTTSDMFRIYSEGGPDRELLFCDLLVSFRFVEQNRESLRTLLSGSQWAAIQKQVMEYAAKNIEKEIRAGYYSISRKVPEEITLQFLAGAAVQVLTWWVENPNPHSPEEMAGMLSDLLKVHMHER